MAFGLCAVRRLTRALEDNTRSNLKMASVSAKYQASVDALTSAIGSVAADMTTVLGALTTAIQNAKAGDGGAVQALDDAASQLDTLTAQVNAIHAAVSADTDLSKVELPSPQPTEPAPAPQPEPGTEPNTAA